MYVIAASSVYSQIIDAGTLSNNITVPTTGRRDAYVEDILRFKTSPWMGGGTEGFLDNGRIVFGNQTFTGREALLEFCTNCSPTNNRGSKTFEIAIEEGDIGDKNVLISVALGPNTCQGVPSCVDSRSRNTLTVNLKVLAPRSST